MTSDDPGELFGVGGSTLARTLRRALAKGAERADVFLQRRTVTSLTLDDGQVRRAGHTAERGAGVRAVQGERSGFAHTGLLTPRGLAEAAAFAAGVAGGPVRVGPPVDGAFAPVGHDDRYPIPEGEPPAAAGIVLRLTSLEAEVRRLEPRVTKVSASLADELSHVAIARSDGALAVDHRPRLVLRVSCVAEAGGRREQASVGYGARVGVAAFDEALRDRLARELVEQVEGLFEARRPPAGRFPVVLAAGSSGILLHEAIGHGLEADFNRKGVSIFADRVGTRVASPHVTLIDTGALPRQHGSLNVDDEGWPAGETVLVEEGVLRSYLHDGVSAACYGVTPTGSARRASFRSPPLPRMRCTCLRPGPHEAAEVVSSVRRGLLAQVFGNGQVQIGAGDFSFYVRLGWWIEDGRPAWPVKDVNLIGNGPDVLAAIDLVGDDLRIDDGTWMCGKAGQNVPVGMGMPTVRVPSLAVGGDGA